MNKLIAIVGLAAFTAVSACHQAPASSVTRIAPTGTGAPDAVTAVRSFMNAVERSDLTAMGNVFGTVDGPASASIPKEELEKREAIMICHLKHDSYNVLAEAPDPGGGHRLVVQVSYQGITRSSDILAVRAADGRWYVQAVNLVPLEDICKRR